MSCIVIFDVENKYLLGSRVFYLKESSVCTKYVGKYTPFHENVINQRHSNANVISRMIEF